MELKIVQEKQKDRTESFFYEGQIATINDGKYTYSLEAQGDIILYNEKLWQDIRNHNAGQEYILNDDQLSKATEDNGWNWINNNWFEVVWWANEGENANEVDFVMGDVAYDYDEGIELLKQYADKKMAEQE